MFHRSIRLASFVCLCLAGWAAAQNLPAAPETFHSPGGYTLHPPAGWKLVTAGLRGKISDAALQQYPRLKNVEFANGDAIFFGPTEDGFAVNVSITVKPGSFVVNDAAVEQYTRQFQINYKLAHVPVPDPTIRTDKVNNLPCLVAEQYADWGDTHMKQWRYVIPAADSTYTVMFSCPRSREEQFKPTVQSVMAGFAVDHPQSWWTLHRVPPLVHDALIVGVIGAAIGVLIWQNQKKAAARRRSQLHRSENSGV
ncbi:MAG: hypothetical protein ACYC26_03820 [Phycisphaerales bacterium]